jgi:acyl carrier protein
MRLDLKGLRAQGDSLPALLRGLVRVAPRRGVAGGVESSSSLAQHLAGMPAAEQDRALAELVCGQVATVLGHGSHDMVDQQRAFTELGFDSLTAVDLRNRLNVVTGLRLPATLIFDYPTPQALANYLRGEIIESGLSPEHSVLDEIDKLEATLSAVQLDDITRTQAKLRLRGLLSLCDDVRNAPDVANVAEELQSASIDEMYEFVGKEFGISFS